MTSKRNRVFTAIIIFSCIILSVIALIFLRFRGSTRIKPSFDIVPGTDIVSYRQDDSTWADEYLGNSKYTLGSSGCLVSSIASALSMEHDIEETPSTLNARLSSDGVYDSEGNMQWESLRQSTGYQVDLPSDISSDTIDSYLSRGIYPVVRVRMYALGNVHYVLIVKAENGRYWCMDPLKDELTDMSDYGNRIYAVRCVY